MTITTSWPLKHEHGSIHDVQTRREMWGNNRQNFEDSRRYFFFCFEQLEKHRKTIFMWKAREHMVHRRSICVCVCMIAILFHIFFGIYSNMQACTCTYCAPRHLLSIHQTNSEMHSFSTSFIALILTLTSFLFFLHCFAIKLRRRVLCMGFAEKKKKRYQQTANTIGM